MYGLGGLAVLGALGFLDLEADAAQRPACRRRDRRLDRRKADPRYLVAVSIDLRDKNWIRRATSE